MKPSTELFTIIKSLTKSEKRFFKLSSSLQSGEKNYLKIFDFIERQSSYDEEELKKAFEGQRFIKHLPSEKNHLYKLILKSLRSYYSGQTINSRLKQEIKNVEILYNKALYKECDKFVSRAKALAKKYEKFYYWFELLSWEKLLLEAAYEYGEFSGNLDRLVEEEAMVIDKLRNLAEYTVIYSRINLVFRTGGFARNEAERKIVDDIASYHLIKGKNTALSDNAASICYYIKGLCAATNRDYENSHLFFNRTKEILDNNPNVKSDSLSRYALTNFFILRCLIEEKEFDKARQLIEEIKAFDENNKQSSVDLTVKVFANLSYYEMILLHAIGEFERSIEFVAEFEENQNRYKDKITKEMEVLLSYRKSYSFFGVGDYKRALLYLNEVLNDNEQNLRQDIYSFARLFNLVIHFELENYDFLDYVIKSTNRYLNKQDKDYEIEGVFIKYIRKLSKIQVPMQRIEVFEKMQNDILPLLEDHSERVILEYFDVKSWIASKIEKVSFETAVRNENA